MTNAITDKALSFLTYLKENDGVQMTADDIAAGMEVAPRSVTGSINGLVKRGFAVRSEETEIELADGTHKKVKFISVTDEGKAYDHEAAVAADEAEAAAKKAAKEAKDAE